MKISKSLLQSIAIGVSLGTLSTSCTSSIVTPILEDIHEVETNPRTDTGEGTCYDWGDCIDCGLG